MTEFVAQCQRCDWESLPKSSKSQANLAGDRHETTRHNGIDSVEVVGDGE